MSDKFNEQVRSSIMRKIRSRDTALEIKIRKLLHAKGYRFRLHRNDLPGKPDIVFPSRKKVMFIHGCFWHQHQEPACPISHSPKSNLEYWIPKLTRTVVRDRLNKDHLISMGWGVLTLWECEVLKWNDLAEYVLRFLNNNASQK